MTKKIYLTDNFNKYKIWLIEAQINNYIIYII